MMTALESKPTDDAAFCAELPGRAARIRMAIHAGELAEGVELVQQLRLNSKERGYDQIVSYAAELEKSCLQSDETLIQKHLRLVVSACDDALIALYRRD